MTGGGGATVGAASCWWRARLAALAAWRAMDARPASPPGGRGGGVLVAQLLFRVHGGHRGLHKANATWGLPHRHYTNMENVVEKVVRGSEGGLGGDAPANELSLLGSTRSDVSDIDPID